MPLGSDKTLWPGAPAPACCSPAVKVPSAPPPLPEIDWKLPTEFPNLSGQGLVSFDVETYDPDLKTKGPGSHRDGRLVGLAIGTEAGFRKYYPIDHEIGPNLPRESVLDWARRELGRPGPKAGANLLYDLEFLAAAGVPVTGPFYDVQIAEPLLDENKLSYSLESLAQEYLNEGKHEDLMAEWITSAFGKHADVKSNIWRAPAQIVGPYAEIDVDLPLRIFAMQKPALEAQNLWDLFILESKLIPMLLAMRQRGVRVDLEQAQRLYDDLEQRQALVTEEIKRSTGLAVDIWAAESIAKIFDQAGVSYKRTAKTDAPSFRKDWLESCEFPVAKSLVEARRLDKFKGTFVKSCILDGHVNGRVHCQFHQLRGDENGAVSGRFSCVAKWTPVTTLTGIKQIKDIQVGDMVWTHRQRWRAVTAVWRKGYEHMLCVKFSNGKLLYCTKMHKLLLQSGEWLTAGVLYASFQQMAYRREYSEDRDALSKSQIIDCCAGFETVEDTLLFSSFYFTHLYGSQGTKSTKNVTLFCIQNGQQKSDERKNRGAAPQLERCLLRSTRISDYSTKWKADTCTSSSSLRYLWNKEITKRMGDSPYRRQWREQQFRQLGYHDSTRSSNYACTPKERTTPVSITSIETCGSYEVLDISVNEDESYEACGVFSHNSSMPCLQNIPVRDEELGPATRAIFLPEEEQQFWALDWSQIEFRLAVHYAALMQLPGAQKVVEQYNQDDSTDYHEVVARLTGLLREHAKGMNYGMIYGMGARKLCSRLGVPFSKGQAILAEYHRGVPFIKPLANALTEQASESGEIITLAGRRRRFHMWEKNGEYAAEYFPGAVRAFTYRALNAKLQGSAADIMKTGMVQMWESGVCDVLGAPHLTEHDELDGSLPSGKIAGEALAEVKHIMETCWPLLIPLKADGGVGKNWSEAKL